MKTVKVCHMTSAHPEEDVRIFHKECVSLAQAGYEVYLVERGESREKNGVHIVGVGEIPKDRRKRMTDGARKVYEAAKTLDCDIYHFHDPELIPYGLKLKKQGKKVVFDSHELYREQIANKSYLPGFARKLIAKGYSVYERRSLLKLDAVIFPCTINGAFPLPGKKTVLINNVPRLDELYDRYDPLAKKNPDSICMVGSLSKSRGITQLVKAAALADCSAYVGGSFSSKEYEQEILSMPEAAHTRFLGRLDRAAVRELLSHSEVGVAVLMNVGQYSLAENLPTKAYEYMAMGLPVVLAHNPYNDRVLSQYGFGVAVDPNDVEAYAAAIRDLLDHPEKRTVMGEKGRDAIAKSFNWSIEANKLIALYRDLAPQA